MKILIISQYYFPETGATSNRIFSLAKYLTKNGHSVRVIAEKPNHPKGIFFKGYKKGIFLNKFHKKIPVTYTWVKTKPKKNFMDRILFYISFMITAVIAAWRADEEFDVIIASSPPLFVGISGWFAAKIHNAKYVFDVRDVWPDVAVAMGELTNKKVIKIAEYIESFIYKGADLITVVTESFKKTILQKAIPESKIEVVSNGTDPELFNLKSSQVYLRNELELPSCSFIVGYIGNHGLAQGLDHILTSAEELNKKDISDILFLFVGSGPKKSELKRIANEKNLPNVLFIDRVPLNEASKYMNAVDVLLVPLADDPIYSQFIPSKLFDSMAAGKPVLLSVKGEAKTVLNKAAGGYYYPAEDSKELTYKIIYLYENRKEGQEMGLNGQKFVRENYSRKKQAEKMNSYIKKLIS